MTIDPTKPLLRLAVGQEQVRHPGKQDKRKRPDLLSVDHQRNAFGPRFEKLREVLDQDNPEMVLKRDPSALAPERLMVFVLQGEVRDFVDALRQVQGLNLVDEDEEALDTDEGISPYLYLLVPDLQALKQIESLWRRWLKGEEFNKEFQPWAKLFGYLREIRVWGPQDRLGNSSEDILRREIEGRGDAELVTVELELVFRANSKVADTSEAALRKGIATHGGQILSNARLPDIGYHALLVRLPVSEVREILNFSADSIAGMDEVMFICPQSIATGIELSDPSTGADVVALPSGDPILALFDGVPVARHPALDGRLNVDDIFELERATLVQERSHGTAMASLITRGDLNVYQPGLPRPIEVIPLLGKNDQFPEDKLIVDLVYQAVQSLFKADGALASHVVVINLSLGNRNCLFDRRMSPWARLLDRLSFVHQVLFVVSAGNHDRDTLEIPNFASWTEYEDAEADPRAVNTLRGIHARVGFRRLLSPSEAINSLTVGAANADAINDAARRSTGIDPYQDRRMPNPSSAVGPGFANSVKPDLLFPGGREHVRMANSGGGLNVTVCRPSPAHGLKVAAPNVEGPSAFSHSGNTSGAAALASRACHQIHDALEDAYGDAFLRLPKAQRAALLKALLVHTASWPKATSDFLEAIMGPPGQYYSKRRKDNVRRMLGYGFADPDRAISCVGDRATFWAIGSLGFKKGTQVDVPIPVDFGARTIPHTISATLAWITPVATGRKAYKGVRLLLEDPASIALMGVSTTKLQPIRTDSLKGTVFTRTWEGKKAAVVRGDNHTLPFWIQREADLNDEHEGDNIPFALAVTIAMPGVNTIYSQVANRIAQHLRPRQRATI